MSKQKKGKKSKKQKLQKDGVRTVKVFVKKARNLAAMDRGGTSDPYCVLFSSFNKQRFKTVCIKKTLNPEWNQEFKFFTSEEEGQIFIKLWDKDRWFSDDYLGEVAIPLGSLSDGEPKEKWFSLSHEPKKKKGSQPGELLLKIHFPRDDGGSSTNNVNSTGSGSNQNIREVFRIGEEIGRGGFSVVHRATNKDQGVDYAVKIIEKNQSEDEIVHLRREIDIMRKLNHLNIISLMDVFEEHDKIYLVMELVMGGELFDQIVLRGTYSERDAANIIRQILEAVKYMHENGIAHRDLKPENLLVSGANKDVIKVTDFGLSKDFGRESMATSCGTPDYVAPEVLRGMAYDNSVDIWSIGVICYILLCGFPPFYGNTDQQIFAKIMRADFDFPSPDWDCISKEAKTFIRAILVLDFHARPTADQCLTCPWIVNKAPSRPLDRLDSLKSGLSDHSKDYARRKAIAATIVDDDSTSSSD